MNDDSELFTIIYSLRYKKLIKIDEYGKWYCYVCGYSYNNEYGREYGRSILLYKYVRRHFMVLHPEIFKMVRLLSIGI